MLNVKQQKKKIRFSTMSNIKVIIQLFKMRVYSTREKENCDKFKSLWWRMDGD